MNTNPSGLIASLYARAADHILPRPAAPAPEPPREEGLAHRAADFLTTLKAGEAQVTAALAGKADPQSVVMALAATELAVETAVTLRDKVVEAYQEILRMPV